MLRSMAAVVSIAVLFPALSAYGDNAKTVDITIKNGQVVGKKSVRVTRGDTVVLRWRSDKPLELHLHGYDVTTIATPGTPAEMKIVARATGRFPVEVHGQSGASGGSHRHRTLFHLEVYPD
jgi:FtsP/CotA-like multicopper oxidase with cupredoxin domain